MILSVTDNTNTNTNHYLNKDTFILHDVTRIIDDEHPIKPQIYLTPQHIKRVQLQDQSLAIIINKLRKNQVCSTPLPNTYFLNIKGVLYQSVREWVQMYEAVVVLSMLRQLVLNMTHDLLGHNGTTILYNYIRQFYFWQELKQDCTNHLCKCKDCQQVSLKSQHYIDSNLRIPNVLMTCIAVDILEEYWRQHEAMVMHWLSYVCSCHL